MRPDELLALRQQVNDTCGNGPRAGRLESTQGEGTRQRQPLAKRRDKRARCKVVCNKRLMAYQNTRSINRFTYGERIK